MNPDLERECFKRYLSTGDRQYHPEVMAKQAAMEHDLNVRRYKQKWAAEDRTSGQPPDIGAKVEAMPKQPTPSLRQTKFLSDNTVTMLNRQIGIEFYSSNLYALASAWFQSKGLAGFQQWMKDQAADEQDHAAKVYEFLVDTGSKLAIPTIPAPTAEWKTPADVTRAVLDHEMFVTGCWKDIANAAKNEDNPAAFRIAQDFLDEQIEEEDNALTLHQKVEMADTGTGILVVDSDLKEYKPSQGKEASHQWKVAHHRHRLDTAGMDKTARGVNQNMVNFARSLRPGLFPGLNADGDHVHHLHDWKPDADRNAEYKAMTDPSTLAYYNLNSKTAGDAMNDPNAARILQNLPQNQVKPDKPTTNDPVPAQRSQEQAPKDQQAPQGSTATDIMQQRYQNDPRTRIAAWSKEKLDKLMTPRLGPHAQRPPLAESAQQVINGQGAEAQMDVVTQFVNYLQSKFQGRGQPAVTGGR